MVLRLEEISARSRRFNQRIVGMCGRNVIGEFHIGVGGSCFAVRATVNALEWREASVFTESGNEDRVHQTLESLGVG